MIQDDILIIYTNAFNCFFVIVSGKASFSRIT